MERVTQHARRPAGPDLVDEDPLLQLVEQIQAGIRRDENCATLVRRFRPLLQSFFFRKGFTSEESRDLTQDVFLRVFKGIDTFRRESRFERWLWEIATHIYLNEVRRRRTEKRDAPEQPLEGSTQNEDGSALDSTLSAPGPSPEEEIVQREQSEALRKALRELPDQMRRCCLLRYERGLKYNEIAFLMKISIETVKAHLHQARKRLEARLGGEKNCLPSPKREES